MSKKINFPTLSNVNKLIPLIKKIDSKKIYSNFGPNYNLATKKIEKYLNLKNLYATITSSGDSALNAIFKTIKLERLNKKIIICPSFAFHSDVNNILNNGFEPFFVDINDQGIGYDDKLLNNVILRNKKNIAAILFVSPFGHPISSNQINLTYKKYKIPIIYDAADSFFNLKNESFNTNILIACSFHPTKTLAGNESGLILSSKKKNSFFLDLINHGIINNDKSNLISGFNGKASEYDCAILVANLKEKISSLGNLLKIKKKFILNLCKDFQFMPGYLKTYSNKITFICKNLKKNKIQENLLVNNINLYKVWGDKCMHQYKKFKNYKKTKMNNSLFFKKNCYSIFIDDRFNEKFIKKVCKKLNEIKTDNF